MIIWQPYDRSLSGMCHVNPVKTRLTKWGHCTQVVAGMRNCFRRSCWCRDLYVVGFCALFHITTHEMPQVRSPPFSQRSQCIPGQDPWSPCGIVAHWKTKQTSMESIQCLSETSHISKVTALVPIQSYSTISRWILQISVNETKRLWHSTTLQRQAARTYLRWKEFGRGVLKRAPKAHCNRLDTAT